LAAKQDDLTPRVFLDKNKNKTLDAGDTTLGNKMLNVEFKQVGGLQDVHLNTNWNLVSFNSLAANSTTTKDLAQIAELSGLNLEMASYESDKWVISALKEEGNVATFYGNEYILVPGRAFFIKTSPTGIYYHTGEMFSNINKELSLQIGWNFFSFSSDVIDTIKPTSYSLSGKCKAAGIGCSLFADYNGQLDNIVLVKEIFYGKDYSLVANKGYILKVDANPGKVSL
jgi:hypothetical protein